MGKRRVEGLEGCGFKFQVSGFWFLVSGFWFQVSGFRFLVSGFWFSSVVSRMASVVFSVGTTNRIADLRIG
jgi:hypothetical protein